MESKKVNIYLTNGNDFQNRFYETYNKNNSDAENCWKMKLASIAVFMRANVKKKHKSQ